MNGMIKSFYRLCLILCITAPIAGFLISASAKDNTPPPPIQPIYSLTIDGAIGPAFADFLYNGIQTATDNNAQLLIVQLNTPGGLLTSTREMVSTIIEAELPIAVWVTPSGAHAASAGTFLLYAGHIAAMNESTNIGAATPVQMRGQIDMPKQDQKTPDTQDPNAKALENKALENKAMEDTAAFIRGIAEMRGRNIEWAEKAVLEADSLTATEALDHNVIDFIAENIDILKTKADGRTITLKNGNTVTLQTQNAPVVHIEQDFKTRILSVITDPNIALILMSIGMYGLILEFYHPGTMIPGTIGVISLIFGLYAMNVLPVNMAGVILVVLGMVFMIAEAFVPSFGIMGFGGLAAFVFGSTILFDYETMPGLSLDLTVIGSIAVVGAIMVGLIVFLTMKVYRRDIITGAESLIGKQAIIVEWQGNTGRVRIQGEVWQAYSDIPLKLDVKDTVYVAKRDDLKLKIIDNI